MPGKKPAKSNAARPRRPPAKATFTEMQPVFATLARRHAEAALAALIEVVGDRTASPAARISAASALLNWGFGKSNSARGEVNDGPTELVIRWHNAQDGAPSDEQAKPKPKP
jgi:hypothetical protein